MLKVGRWVDNSKTAVFVVKQNDKLATTCKKLEVVFPSCQEKDSLGDFTTLSRNLHEEVALLTVEVVIVPHNLSQKNELQAVQTHGKHGNGHRCLSTTRSHKHEHGHHERVRVNLNISLRVPHHWGLGNSGEKVTKLKTCKANG